MERMEKQLYEASVEGNLTVLIMLLHEDPLILDRVTLTRYGDTPLHVASMLNHVDFVKEILIRKPHLAMEPDSQRRLPLHIASAKGHLELVRVLLSVIGSSEACLARDCDGRNPLHLAAIKGRFDVVKELVHAQPQAARAMVQQDTLLHLCVIHNQPEILKFLIETTAGDPEFVNSTDSCGNNILHLAAVYRQTETIDFLLLSTSIEVNASNTNGETLMDILAQGPRDMKYQQILQSLTRAAAVEAKIGEIYGQVPQNSTIEIGLDSLDYNKKQGPPVYLKKTSINSNDWLERMRTSLMVVASLIATMAFQAGVNPPGGVWQDDSTTNPPHNVGDAVMVSKFKEPVLYRIFVVANTVGFLSTLSIILLLISGLPFVKRRLFMWILMVIMWIAVSAMSVTYLASIMTWSAPGEWELNLAVIIVLSWMGLMGLLAVAHAIRLIVIIGRHTIRLIAKAIRGIRRLVFS